MTLRPDPLPHLTSPRAPPNKVGYPVSAPMSSLVGSQEDATLSVGHLHILLSSKWGPNLKSILPNMFAQVYAYLVNETHVS
jgi:hypothetical protein